MDLIIAEKPSVAHAIAAVLPGSVDKQRTHWTVGNTVLTWCFGHLFENAAPDDYDPAFATWSLDTLPIVPTEWRLKPRKAAAAQISAIAKLIPKATRVIHAGDPDSEGQLLVQEVLDHCANRKPVFRILVNDYNPEKVRQAYAAMKPNTDPQFRGWHDWALCRSRIDWLFGLNLTRAYTLRARVTGKSDSLLTVGRVQTPTLAIVVARDEAIEAFRPVPFYRLVAAAEGGGVSFAATWQPKPAQSGLDDNKRLIDAQVAAALVARLAGAAATVATFASDAKKQKAPLPFYLGTLQMAANDAFGYSAAQTLEAAQALYETHKLTTYPRTDCPYLSDAQHSETRDRLAAVAANMPALQAAVAGADPTRKSAAFNDSKVTAHHGIVPTAGRCSTAGLSDVERNVYALVAKAYLAQFYPDHVYQQTVIELDIGGEAFVAKGRVPTSPGWKAVFSPPEPTEGEAGDSDDDGPQRLPQLATGQGVTNKGVQSQQRMTTPPSRFNEKLLIQAMENVHKYVSNPAAKARLKEGDGIGTPATRAGIIEGLKERGFLIAKGRQITSSPVGRALVKSVPQIATDPGFTGLTEQSLDLVAAGSLTINAFMAKTVELVRVLVEQANKCPTCKAGRLAKNHDGVTPGAWACSACGAAFVEAKRATTKARKTVRKTARKTTGTTAKKAPAKRAAARTAKPRTGGAR